MRALLQATLNHLRDTLSLDASTSEVMPTGKPPAFAGEVFYTVHPGTVSNQDVHCLDEQYSLDVTITLRSGKVPTDRVGTELLLAEDDGIYDRADAVRAAIHMRYVGLMNDANTDLTASVNGFVEPLVFLGYGRVQEQGGNWFGGKGGPGSAGISLTLSFGRARRAQTIESMT